jgi:hypothetical protein
MARGRKSHCLCKSQPWGCLESMGSETPGIVYGWQSETVREGRFDREQTWTLEGRERDGMVVEHGPLKPLRWGAGALGRWWWADG